jgi:hypothetical protein
MLYTPHHLSVRQSLLRRWSLGLFVGSVLSVRGGWFVGSLCFCVLFAVICSFLICSWWLVCRSPDVFKVGLWCLVVFRRWWCDVPQLSTTVTVLLLRRCGFGCSELCLSGIHLCLSGCLSLPLVFSFCVWCSVFLFCGSVVSFVVSLLWIRWFFRVSVLLLVSACGVPLYVPCLFSAVLI